MPQTPQRRAKSDGIGQPQETWPPIPTPPGYLVEAVNDWLVEQRESKRPLSVAAPLLAIICILHERGHPFPARRRIADAIGTGKDSIDAARSTAQANEEITETIKVRQGRVAGRASITRDRYYVPSNALWQVYQSALQQRRRA